MLAGLLAQAFHELVRGGKYVVPAKEGDGVDVEVLANELAAGRHDAVHEHGRHAQLGEGVDEGLRHRGIGLLALKLVGSLGGVAPALVGGAQVVVAHSERAVRLELVHGLLKREGGLLGGLHHGGRGGAGGDATVAIGALVALLDGDAVEAAAGQAVEDAGQKGAFLKGRIDDALVVAGVHLVAVLVLAGHAGVVCLGAKAHRLLGQAERQPMRAHLLAGVVVEQVVCRRGRRLRGRAGLFAHVEQVVAGADGALCKVPTQGLPHGGLRDAVEVDVVLTDKLVDLCVVRAPPVAPVERAVLVGGRGHLRGVGSGLAHEGGILGGDALGHAGGLGIAREHGTRIADGRPQALGPAPAGDVGDAIDLGHRNAPVDVAGDAEGHERLAAAEAHATVGEHCVGVVALLPAGEGDGKAALVALGLQHGVLRKLILDGIEGLAELVLDVELGRQQPLLHSLGDHGANLRVLGELGGIGLHKVEVGRQVEVEVVDRAQLGHLAGELALRRDELLGLKLVAQVALVGIGLLGLAALDGAAADHLTAVEERAGLGIVELQRGALGDGALLVQALDNLGGHLVVNLRSRLKARAAVDITADVVVVEGRGLAGVIGLDILANGLVVALVLLELAVALHDGRAIAVGARGEDDVLAAQAVAQEAGEEVGRDKDAANVAKVKALVAVGLAGGNDGAARPAGTVVHGVFGCHGTPSHMVGAQPGVGLGDAVVNSCISFDIIAHADGYVAGALS